MLDYTAWTHAYGLSLEDREEGMKEYILENLNKRIKYFADKSEEIDKLIYERNLLELDLVRLAKEDIAGNFKLNIFAGLVSNTILYDAWKGSFDPSMENDLTDEQKKEYKDGFEFVSEQINRRLWKNDPDFKFKKIIRCDYDGHAYEFHYDYKGLNIYLHVHNFDQVDLSTYREILKGYFIGYEKKSNYWSIAVRDPEWEKLHDKFIEWFDKGDRKPDYESKHNGEQ